MEWKNILDRLIDLDVVLKNITIEDIIKLRSVIPDKKMDNYIDAIKTLTFLSSDYDCYRTQKKEIKSERQIKYEKLYN